MDLLVEGGGIFQGRFLMTPAPGARPTLEPRLLAIAFADQVGAAMASSHPAGNVNRTSRLLGIYAGKHRKDAGTQWGSSPGPEGEDR